MPIFYNTSAPTPSTRNTINSVTVDYGIRDFLLNSNLGLNGGFYPQLSMSINGAPLVGQPVLDTSINNNTNVTPIGLPLETFGLFRYDIAILPNQYKNADQNAPQLVNIEDVVTTQGIFGSVDFPQGIQSYPTTATEEISQFGLLGKTEFAQFRETATLYNLYVDETKQVDVGDWISLQPSGFNQQLTGYLDEFGNLNQGGGPAVQSANVLGSILNGQGLGLAKSGLLPNFDFRASLAGRILGATGNFNDTKLGQIGGQQLAFSLANNAAFNIQEELLGSLNIQDNILALVKGGPLPGLRPNYSITVPSSGVGRAFDIGASILGFQLPRSFLSDAGSIFLSENQSGNIDRANSMLENTGKGQIEALISNVNANIIGSSDYDNPQTTPFRSGYVPGYKNSKGEIAITPNIYAFVDDITKGTVLNFLVQGNSVIPEISYNRSGMIKKYGFLAPEDMGVGPKGNSGYNNRKISDVGFTWTSTNGSAVNSEVTSNSSAFPDEIPQTVTFDGVELNQKKSLLYKTQQLFNSNGMLNIVTAKGNMGKNSSQIETANGGGFSRGSAVIIGSGDGNRYSEDGIYDGEVRGAENTYCRSWTTVDRYESVFNLVKKSGLFNRQYPYRHQFENSVLDDNGFVKISPYKNDSFGDSEIKRYMFSIENLAWSDNFKNLIPCEQGPGDPLTGKKGRIMWFPPYDIQFNESTSVNWEKTDFIGRGESIYTYNNTERSGTLSFKIIVDHPSYANSFAGFDGPDDNYIASYFAGCVEPNQYFKNRLTPSEIQKITVEEAVKPQITTPPPQTPPPNITFYFANDRYDLNQKYENSQTGATPQDVIDYSLNSNGFGFGIGVYQGQVTPGVQSAVTGYTDNYNYGLNYDLRNPITIGDFQVYGANDISLMAALGTTISEKCKSCIVEVSGYASSQGNKKYNEELAQNRARTVIEALKTQIFNELGISKEDIERRFRVGTTEVLSSTGCIVKEDAPTDSEACKKDRKAIVKFIVDNSLSTESQPEPVEENTVQRTISNNIQKRFYTECSYFEKLTEKDKFIFDSFREKIRYFHPAFHSTTPEGLNSRLTFLQQCTRQGSTSEFAQTDNLSFGRPPVCILRIGDFYNTKIVIDNVTIDYEPLVWDLNPDGVGVQPMIANVSLSFKFIGGSTLSGPINKLQNALSFNYYANTHVYDPRADYISKTKPRIRVKNEADKEIPDNENGFYINNTVNDMYFGSAVEYNEKNIIDVGEVQPEINQQASSEKSTPQTNSSDTGSTANLVSDVSKIKIGSSSYNKSNGRIVINLVLTSALSKEYECDITIRSTNNNTTVYNFPFKINLQANSLNQTFETGVSELGLTELPSDFSTIKLLVNGIQKNGIVNGTLKFE